MTESHDSSQSNQFNFEREKINHNKKPLLHRCNTHTNILIKRSDSYFQNGFSFNFSIVLLSLNIGKLSKAGVRQINCKHPTPSSERKYKPKIW